MCAFFLAASRPGWDLKAFSTALAITFLREKYPERRDLWELVVDKADAWLKLQPSFREMLLEAVTIIAELET